mgnify:CR=1 FL=1
MSLLEILKAANARISGGSDYLWNCFGHNARYLDLADIMHDEYCSVVFDCKTYEVYTVELTVPGQDQAFRYINPAHLDAYLDEAEKRNIDPNVAWDHVKYTQVTEENTVLEYIKDIGEMYYDDLPVPEEST